MILLLRTPTMQNMHQAFQKFSPSFCSTYVSFKMEKEKKERRTATFKSKVGQRYVSQKGAVVNCFLKSVRHGLNCIVNCIKRQSELTRNEYTKHIRGAKANEEICWRVGERIFQFFQGMTGCVKLCQLVSRLLLLLPKSQLKFQGYARSSVYTKLVYIQFTLLFAYYISNYKGVVVAAATLL